MAKVHSLKNAKAVRRYRLIPYDDLANVLRDEGEAFLEGPFRRQTVWKAARKLESMLGKKIRTETALLRFPGEQEVLEGYSFVVEGSEAARSQSQKETS